SPCRPWLVPLRRCQFSRPLQDHRRLGRGQEETKPATLRHEFDPSISLALVGSEAEWQPPVDLCAGWGWQCFGTRGSADAWRSKSEEQEGGNNPRQPQARFLLSAETTIVQNRLYGQQNPEGTRPRHCAQSRSCHRELLWRHIQASYSWTAST